MHYIRHMWNATSKSNVEPKLNFRLQFSRRFGKVVFNLKLLIQTSHLKAVTSRIKLGTCEIRRLNWVMVTVRYDTYGIFYIPVNFAFNLPHYFTSYVHHTGKKESEKEKEKKQCHDNLAYRGFEPGPSEYVRTKNELFYPMAHPGKRWQKTFKISNMLFYFNPMMKSCHSNKNPNSEMVTWLMTSSP